MKNRLDLNYEKLWNLNEQPGNLIPLDRGKCVPSFDEMMDIDLVEVDFDDPTTNVRGRRALVIAKPTLRGYWPRRSVSYRQTKNKQETKIAIWILRI